jgi:hypothetical protein
MFQAVGWFRAVDALAFPWAAHRAFIVTKRTDGAYPGAYLSA